MLDIVVSAFPSDANVLVWSGASSLSVAYTAWKAIRDGEHCVVVTTRVGAYTLPHPSTRVVLIASGEDDYFDQEQNPHIDVLRALHIARKYSAFTSLSLCTFPRPEDGNLSADLWSAGEINLINLKDSLRISEHIFISDELIEQIRTNPPINKPWILYFNMIQGDGFTAEKIRQELQTIFREYDINLVTAGMSLPVSGIVIITKTFLHMVNILSPELIGLAIINADQECILRGFRSLEQGGRTLRRLVSVARGAEAPIIIQSFDIKAIKNLLGPTSEYFNNEETARRILGYPPFKDTAVALSRDGKPPNIQKTEPYKIISEWLTAPPEIDIITNPDQYDFAHFDTPKP